MPTKTSNSKSAWSAKDIYDMIFSTYGNAHVNANNARAKEASKYMIPYIPEKEIMLTTGRYNTGKISTNLLDSIYNASQRTGVPLDIALGLAGRESTLGIGRGFKKGKSVSGTDLYSNWQQIQTIPNNKAQMKKWNSLLGRTDLTDEDYDFKSGFLIRAQDSLENTKPLDENPIDNALKFYQTGKYNPGDSRHTQMVEDDAKVLMSDPAIQKWLKTKTGTQMKCGGRRKAQLGLDIREGGVAIPIANNMYYMNGRSHDEGGIGIGPNNKNGLEVEGGEVVKVGKNDVKVFSSVPLLRGVSPAQLVMGGANPNKVFAAQEEFKDRNRINDDGTRYEVGGEKIYTPSKSIQRQIQETGRITIGGAPTIGGLRTAKYVKDLATAKGYAKQANKIFTKVDNFVNNSLQGLINKHKITPNQADAYKKFYNEIVGVNGVNIPKTASFFLNNESKEMKAGGIYIKPSKRGTFTAAATKHGMGVQEFASKVLANKEDYSPAMVKKANFARNASRWKKEYGGDKNVLPELIVTPRNGYNKIYDASGINKRKKIAQDVLQILPFSGFVNDVLGFTNPINAGGAVKSAMGYGAAKAGLPFLSIPGIAFNGALGLPDLIQDVQTLYKDIKTPKEEFNKNKKEFGGNMIYAINGNVKNGLNLRPKAQYGKTIKINRDSYETVDEAVERYKQLYRIKYGKEPSENDINRIAWTKSLENSIYGNPNLITGYGPNVGVRSSNVTKIVSGANKGRQIARTQTVIRNKNVKSAAPQRQAINNKVSQAARAERQSQFDAWQQGEVFKASTMPTDAVAVNRPTIGAGVRSGRKGRVDDIVAIERSQRSVDPLSSKSEFSVYDKAYAKKVNGKMNQFTNALLASGTGGIVAGSMTYDDIVGDTIYDEKVPVQNHIVVNNNQTNKSINSNIKTQNKPSNKVKINQNNTVNGTFDNARPQFYAEKRLSIAGNQSIAEKAGLARSGWSYGENPTFDYVPNINISIPTNYAKAVGDNSKKSTSSTPRGEGTKASTPKAAAKTTTKGSDTKYGTPLKEKKESLYMTGIKNNSITPLRAGMEKIKSPSSTGGGTQSKDGRWVGQYKTTNVGDWIGLGSNLAGTIASYFMTKNAINKMPEPIKPVMAQAAKLKTRYNVEPQLTEIREAEQMNRASVRRNTQSSNTSLAREQRLMNEARGARNTLYGQKENIETQLINQDRLNRQSVMRDNVRAYNEYLNKVTATKMAQNEMRASNINNLISGLTGSVNSILGNIESRRATNNTLRAIAAANPNVDARLIGGFDYYIDPITKKKYNKNQQYVGTING